MNSKGNGVVRLHGEYIEQDSMKIIFLKSLYHTAYGNSRLTKNTLFRWAFNRSTALCPLDVWRRNYCEEVQWAPPKKTLEDSLQPLLLRRLKLNISSHRCIHYFSSPLFFPSSPATCSQLSATIGFYFTEWHGCASCIFVFIHLFLWNSRKRVFSDEKEDETARPVLAKTPLPAYQ